MKEIIIVMMTLCILAIVLSFNVLNIFGGLVAIFCTLFVYDSYHKHSLTQNMMDLQKNFNMNYRQLFNDNEMFIFDKIWLQKKPFFCFGRHIENLTLYGRKSQYGQGGFDKTYPLVKLAMDIENHSGLTFLTDSNKNILYALIIDQFYNLSNQMDEKINKAYRDKDTIQCMFYIYNKDTKIYSQRNEDMFVLKDEYGRIVLYNIVRISQGDQI